MLFYNIYIYIYIMRNYAYFDHFRFRLSMTLSVKNSFLVCLIIAHSIKCLYSIDCSSTISLPIIVQKDWLLFRSVCVYHDSDGVDDREILGHQGPPVLHPLLHEGEECPYCGHAVGGPHRLLHPLRTPHHPHER